MPSDPKIVRKIYILMILLKQCAVFIDYNAMKMDSLTSILVIT